MKVLVATRHSQGFRKNDFCFVPEGELVTFASECDGERVDGPCGCRRSMSGMVTRKATTTFKVVDRPDLTFENLSDAVYKSLLEGGWLKLMKPEDALGWANGDARELARLAAAFPVGFTLEKRGPTIQMRTVQTRTRK